MSIYLANPGSEILIFTPKGHIKTLPTGSTALDFAYDIHTEIGDKTIGAKVNYKLVGVSFIALNAYRKEKGK